MTYTKTITYDDDDITEDNARLEIELQTISSTYGFSPKILNTIFYKDKCVIEMEIIDEPCLADKYGTDSSDIPESYWEQIHNIIWTLYNNEGIEYIDITPYNFIEKDGVVYIIDFGHAYYTDEETVDVFLDEFFEGGNKWNEYFA